MKRKVCQIIPTLVQGGAEKQMTLLACGLDREQFETHVIVLTHSGEYEDVLRRHGIQVHHINKRGKFDPLGYRRLKQLLVRIAPDVVHSWIFAANCYGRVAAKHAGVPLIIAGERCVDSWKSRWHLYIDRYLEKYSQYIATNSQGVVDFYTKHGLNSTRFVVIPNGIEPPSSPRLSREELFQRLRIPASAAVVGAVGRLWPQKGYPDLLWAAELLRVAHGSVQLVIIGDGPDLAHLQELRDRYGAVDSVRFVGAREDAAELIGAFDVLWNGSRYEGQSNTIMEAMARGTPVIASDIAGNRDLVEHGNTGYLFQLGDVSNLTRLTFNLLNDEPQRLRLAQAAEEKIHKDFSVDAMVRAYECLYQRN